MKPEARRGSGDTRLSPGWMSQDGARCPRSSAHPARCGQGWAQTGDAPWAREAGAPAPSLPWPADSI